MGPRSGRLLAAIAAGTLLAAATGCGDDELVGLDRVGSADAPKVLKLQINADYSPQASTPSAAEGFRKLFAEWARKHPDWRLDLNIVPASMSTTEQARLLEKARVGQAPDCANVDSFTVPLFIEQEALVPLDEHFAQDQLDDLLPYVREVITGPDDRIYAWWFSTDLRVLYRRTDLVPEAPRTWEQLIEAGRQAVRKDAGGRRLPVQRRALGGGDVRQPRLLLVAGRRAARRAGPADLRRGREPRADAGAAALPAAHGRRGRHAEPRHDDHQLRRVPEVGRGRLGRDVPRRLLAVGVDGGVAGQGGDA